MDEIKNKIEAVLFTLGKFVSVEELARACEIDSINIVQEKLEELRKDYETKDGAIEIQQVDNLYKLNVKKHYGLLTNKLLSASEMDGPTTKTLAVIEEKKIMQRFFETLGKEMDKVAYGMAEVRKALEFGAVDVLLVSEDLDEDVIEELEKKCEEYGTKLQLISNETREGKQLIDLGGIAALLRYAI